MLLSLLNAYTMKGNEILSNVFSVSIEMVMCFFLLVYLNSILQWVNRSSVVLSGLASEWWKKGYNPRLLSSCQLLVPPATVALSDACSVSHSNPDVKTTQADSLNATQRRMFQIQLFVFSSWLLTFWHSSLIKWQLLRVKVSSNLIIIY